MKIPNYDPAFSKSSYKQGHPCMPSDVFRMLICGPSNSGKTNILLHITELLEFDKIYLFSKNLHQNKYQALLQDFAERINPKVGYEVIEAPTASLIILSTGGTETVSSLTSLKPSTRCRKTSGITAAIFVFSDFFHEKTSGLRTR